jgi:hypothetical protein
MAAKRNTGTTAGSSVCRQSSMDLTRASRKNARKRISAGLASSDGWNDMRLPSLIQRWVLCERSTKKTAISSSVVTPKSVNTMAGFFQRR